MPNEPKPKAEQKPSGKPKQEEKLAARPVQATPENFGMLFAAVMTIKETLGHQSGTAEVEVINQEKQHVAAMETIEILSKTNALVRYGSYLMVALAASMIYLLLEIHKLEVLIASLRR